MAKYSKFFYEEMKETSLRSARAVIPRVLEFIRPKSVIDVGCGRGNWLLAWKEAGVTDIFGIDGPWVEQERLVIPKEQFQSHELDKPFTVKRRADLAMSLEVAEHLPDASADLFVENLTSFAPVVLFSAAVPLQGGSGHVNEQWPTYWEEKFKARGYVPVDALRRRLWNDKRVSFFYAQNILFYVKASEFDKYLALKREMESGHGEALPLVHPQMYLYYGERWRLLVPYLSLIPVPLLHSGKKILVAFRRFFRGAASRYNQVVAQKK